MLHVCCKYRPPKEKTLVDVANFQAPIRFNEISRTSFWIRTEAPCFDPPPSHILASRSQNLPTTRSANRSRFGEISQKESKDKDPPPDRTSPTLGSLKKPLGVNIFWKMLFQKHGIKYKAQNSLPPKWFPKLVFTCHLMSHVEPNPTYP